MLLQKCLSCGEIALEISSLNVFFPHSVVFFTLLANIQKHSCLIRLSSTSGSIVLVASRLHSRPSKSVCLHWVVDSICNVTLIKTAFMMNLVPAAKKFSSGTLSPAPGAMLQIGSPKHSALCYSLCHIAQAKSWGEERGFSVQGARLTKKWAKACPRILINFTGFVRVTRVSDMLSVAIARRKILYSWWLNVINCHWSSVLCWITAGAAICKAIFIQTHKPAPLRKVAWITECLCKHV